MNLLGSSHQILFSRGRNAVRNIIAGLVVASVGLMLHERASAQTFADVPTDYWAYSFIETFAAGGITSGCGAGNYCPEDLVTRAQMAVFLERAMRGNSFSPPPATGTVFLDVGASDFAAAFIELLYQDGITGGCGGGNYCPNESVTRAQMAVFLLRAKHGSGYSPPAPTGVFGDVDTGYWAAAWIEQMKAEGITSGCGGGNYCPEDPVTRAQMAVFLTRAFGFPPGSIPTPPANVAASSGPGDGTIVVTWDHVPGAVAYKVYWQPGPTVDTNSLNIINVSGETQAIHADLVDEQDYSYVVTALRENLQGNPSDVATAAPRRPVLFGRVILPEFEVRWTNGLPGGGIYSICLFNLQFSLIGECDIETEVDPATGEEQPVLTDARDFAFTVDRNQAYILGVNMGGNFGFSALTRIVTADSTRNVSLESEVAINLVTLTELTRNGLPTDNFAPLGANHDAIVDKADLAVGRLDAYYADPNANREADRYVDAIRSFVLNRWNQSLSVFVSDLEQAWLPRAYGAGIGHEPDLDTIVDNPQPPLPQLFTFVRRREGEQTIAISDVIADRWDFAKFGSWGHIATGDTRMVFENGGGYIYLEDYATGTTTGPLTPNWLFAYEPVMSPDGTKIAFSAIDFNAVLAHGGNTANPALYPRNLYTMNVFGGELTKLTDDIEPKQADEIFSCLNHGNSQPSWSPDGKWLAFVKCDEIGVEGNLNDMVSNLERLQPAAISPGDPVVYLPGERQVLFDFASFPVFLILFPNWSPDGTLLNFGGVALLDPDLNPEIYVLDFLFDPSNPALLVHNNPTNQQRIDGSFSTDGRVVAFTTLDPQGGVDISVMSAYTGETVHHYGGLAIADGEFRNARFTAADLALIAQDGVETDENGNVIVSGVDPRSEIDGCGNNCNSTGTAGNLYQVIIPAANTLGLNFNVPSW